MLNRLHMLISMDFPTDFPICPLFPSPLSTSIRPPSKKVFLLFMDGSVTFALFRSGEIRCHRSSTGQILATGKLPKGRQLQAASLLGERFILGDDLGGLWMLQRDLSDLRHFQSLEHVKEWRFWAMFKGRKGPFRRRRGSESVVSRPFSGRLGAKETQQLCSQGASIAALAALRMNLEACLCARMDGTIELLQAARTPGLAF